MMSDIVKIFYSFQHVLICVSKGFRVITMLPHTCSGRPINLKSEILPHTHSSRPIILKSLVDVLLTLKTTTRSLKTSDRPTTSQGSIKKLWFSFMLFLFWVVNLVSSLLFYLLWINKAKVKDKIYMWVSVLWKTTN